MRNHLHWPSGHPLASDGTRVINLYYRGCIRKFVSELLARMSFRYPLSRLNFFWISNILEEHGVSYTLESSPGERAWPCRPWEVHCYWGSSDSRTTSKMRFDLAERSRCHIFRFFRTIRCAYEILDRTVIMIPIEIGKYRFVAITPDMWNTTSPLLYEWYQIAREISSFNHFPSSVDTGCVLCVVVLCCLYSKLSTSKKLPQKLHCNSRVLVEMPYFWWFFLCA